MNTQTTDRREVITPEATKARASQTRWSHDPISWIVHRSGLQLHESTSAKDPAKRIRETWVKNPVVLENFGGEAVFNATVDKIAALDQRFQSQRGIYFQLGSSPAKTAQMFADTQLKYRQTSVRPSLPAQVVHYLNEIGLSEKDPYYQAALLVAARAEVEHPSHPEYHGPYHFSDVIAQTIEFLKKNNELAAINVRSVMLSPQELAIGIAAAAGHDIGHPGGKNAYPGEKMASDPFRLEKKSVQIIEPLLQIAGMPRESIARTKVAILATSPDMNGPANLLREISRLDKAGEPIEWQKLPDHESFFDLRLLAEDPAARLLSQTLRAADIGQSCLFGLRSNEIATLELQAEWENRGYTDKLLGDSIAPDGAVIRDGQSLKARKGFLDFVAYGEKGPDAAGVRAAVGHNYADLYAETQAKLAVHRID
jgi:3'5'-cyclic nucleotide phosphodiesterase